jgi:hypothetical protein
MRGTSPVPGGMVDVRGEAGLARDEQADKNQKAERLHLSLSCHEFFTAEARRSQR